MKICRKCFSVNNGKKWVTNQEKWQQTKEAGADEVLCEACRRIRDKIVYGIVYLEGPVLAERRDEIMRMLKREEEIEVSHNHLSRILAIEDNTTKVVITTINQWLAMHIGKQFKKTFKGRLKISRDPSGRRGRGTKGREEVVVHWWQECSSNSQ